jgi:WD40 repeat protein
VTRWTLLALATILVALSSPARAAAPAAASATAPAVAPVTAPAAAPAAAPKPVVISIDGASNHRVLSPNGKLLAFETGRGVSVRDTATGAEVAALKPEAWGLAFTPDGKSLITGGSNAADSISRVWDVATWKVRLELADPKAGTVCMQVTPDSGRLLILDTVFQVGGLVLWDLSTGAKIARFDLGEGQWMTAALSPDGKTIYALAGKEAIRSFDVASAKELKAVPLEAGNYFSTLAPAAGRVVSTVGTLQLWDIATGKPVALAKGDPRDAEALSFVVMPDGKTAAVEVSAGGIKASNLLLWDLAAAAPKARTAATFPRSICLVASPDGKRLFAGCRDGSIRAWDAATLKPILVIPDAFEKIPDNVTTNLLNLVASADGSVLVSHYAQPSPKSDIKIWTLGAAKP